LFNNSITWNIVAKFSSCLNNYITWGDLYIGFWIFLLDGQDAGADSGGGRTRRTPPLKLKKKNIFWRKIVIFHTKYPKIFAPPSAIGKIWFFGVKSWFFTRNTPKIFAPPSARRNFFKCAPLTWNPGSAPEMYMGLVQNDKKAEYVLIVINQDDYFCFQIKHGGDNC
jgi:hypothetical protein